MNFATRILSKLQRVDIVMANYSKHARKYGNHSRIVVSLDDKTLTGRLLLHIKPSSNHPTYLRELDLISQKTNVLTEHEKIRRMRKLDTGYCENLENIDTDTVFHILNDYMLIASNQITRFNFYHAAIEYLSDGLFHLSIPEVVQLMFYIGLQKKNREASRQLRKCLKCFKEDDVKSLSIEDLCIICNSTYKTSTKVQNTVLLDQVKYTINENLYLLKDPAFFITLLKTLRHNRYQNEDILSTISCTIFFNATYQFYGFGAICHILAAFSDYLYYDKPLFILLTEKCMQLLEHSKVLNKTSYVTENIRPKDIKRLLWCCSYVNHSLTTNDLKEVEAKIMQRLQHGLYENDIETLLDSVFYMWMMNYQAVELINNCFAEENSKYIKGSKSGTKQRLNILLTCMKVENLSLFKSLQIKPFKYNPIDVRQQVLQRPALQRIYNCLSGLSSSLEIDKFEYECQIPHINIVGITGYKKIYKTVYIEVLDDFVCVKNVVSFPAGPMQLKLRLLDKFNEGLVTVSTDDVNEMDNSNLEEFLLSEIKMVC